MNNHHALSRFINLLTPEMHKKRREALLACVNSAMSGSAATVTQLGRGIASDAMEKHCIKRADRLCRNYCLAMEIPGIYSNLSRLFCTPFSRPVILVDWSDLDEFGNHFLLRGSIVFDGRSTTLYEQVHALSTKEKPASHKAFLRNLRTVLPEGCRPIIVTDAGFRGPFFKQVLAMGWDYVGRVRSKTTCRQADTDTWKPVKALYEYATNTPKVLGEFTLAATSPLETRFVIYKKGSRGRHKMTRHGKISKSAASKKHAEREREPWLLATSLEHNSHLANKVVKIYWGRMQIEEGFRDTKCATYGLALKQNRTLDLLRLTTLIFIATVASVALLLAGIMADQSGLSKHYQANSIKHRRVLSFHYLGKRVFNDHRTQLTWQSLQLAKRYVYEMFSWNEWVVRL